MDAFHNAKPFDLWRSVPSAVRTVLPNVSWSRERLHALTLPTVELPLDDLRWQLDLPWWRNGPGECPFSVAPNQVRDDPERFAKHWQRTIDSDLRFPIHLLQRDRLTILDGVHRLLKADVQAQHTIPVHIVGLGLFVERVVDLKTTSTAS